MQNANCYRFPTGRPCFSNLFMATIEKQPMTTFTKNSFAFAFVDVAQMLESKHDKIVQSYCILITLWLFN